MIITRPLIEAHRGDKTNAPENTLAAFSCAIELGVPSIELDVHASADGALIVIHDFKVDRTTNGSGTVAEMTLAEIKALDAGALFPDQYAGEQIPTLEEAFELLKPTDVKLNIEIKASSEGLDVPTAVTELLISSGKANEYIVSSFDLEALLVVQKLSPETTLALIGNGPEILPVAREHGFPWIHCKHDTVDANLIATAHADGLKVNVWTVNEPEQMAYWRELGVDKICTNDPGKLLKYSIEH